MSATIHTIPFATDLHLPEGPVYLPDGSWLCVEDAPRGTVTLLSADGQTRRVVARTGRPNGLAVDRDGVIWVAESGEPLLLRVAMDGRTECFLTGCGDERFLFPNDLCFGPDGALYLTDSGILPNDLAPGNVIHPHYDQLPYDGRVYRIDTATKAITRLDSGLRLTNGIAFGPDQNLYVNETLTGLIYRYRWHPDGTVGSREAFGQVIRPDAPPGFRGPDGMAFGRDGRLYVAVYGQGDVTVLDATGAVAERLPTQGSLPTNVAFGHPDDPHLYVTEYELGQLERLPVATSGLPLWN